MDVEGLEHVNRQYSYIWNKGSTVSSFSLQFTNLNMQAG